MKAVYKEPIELDKDCNSYIYKETVSILIGFHKEILPLNDLKKISGGKIATEIFSLKAFNFGLKFQKDKF